MTGTPRDNCICGARLATTGVPSAEGFLRCVACGSHASLVRRPAGELAAWTDSDAYQGGQAGLGAIYADYAGDDRQRLAEARARVRRWPLAALGSGQSAFEIGCGSGSVLAALAERGVRVAGCDLSRRFAALGESRGVPIAVGDYMDLPTPAAPYDAILMLGTAPNLDALSTVLSRVRSELAPGGFLLLNFPAADGWISRLYGRRHWMFARSVAQFPSRAGLSACLQGAGFSIARMRHDRQAPSLGKLLRHSRLDRFAPRGWLAAGVGLPFALPIPSIYEIVARRDG